MVALSSRNQVGREAIHFDKQHEEKNTIDISPFVLPGLIIFCTFLAGVGILFMCIRLARKNMRGARGVLVSLRGRTLLMLMLSWPTLIVSLFSFTALGVVSCRIGFHPTTPTPLTTSVTVTDELASGQAAGLVKLSTSVGSVIWTHPLPTVDNSLQDESGNAVDEVGQVIYVHGWLYKERDQPPLGVISAYRAGDGSLLWSAPRVSQQASVRSFPLYVSDPIVANGMVYALGSSTHDSLAIYALRATNGSIAWSAPLPNQTNGESASAFTLGSGLLVAIAPDGDISAWYTGDGSAAWHTTVKALSAEVRSHLLPTLLLANQILYIVKTVEETPSSNQSLVLALQASNGQMIWQDPLRPANAAAISQFGTFLYLNTASSFYKLDARSGALLWQRDFRGASTPVEADNVVYVLANDSLSALRASNGSQIWSYAFRDSGGVTLQMISPNVLLVTSAPRPLCWLVEYLSGRY